MNFRLYDILISHLIPGTVGLLEIDLIIGGTGGLKSVLGFYKEAGSVVITLGVLAAI